MDKSPDDDRQAGPDPGPRELDDTVMELIRNAREGCDSSKSDLLELCRRYLLKVANQDIQSGLRPKLAASDAVQETMLKAYQGLPTFRGETESELLSWLRTILQNQLKDAKRHYFESQKRDLSREREFDSQSIEEQDTASQIASDDEESQRVRQAIERLPDDYRRVVELRNWHLKSFEEIGDELGRTAEATRKLWVRAIAKLEQSLRTSHE